MQIKPQSKIKPQSEIETQAVSKVIPNAALVVAQVKAAKDREAARAELGMVDTEMRYQVHHDGTITRR